MSKKRKEQICALLKGIETGDEASVAVVNPNKYIQHNPQTQEGGVGLAELFKQLAKSSPRVNIVRVFSDGDFVFAHTEYDFNHSNVGFEVFRFEGGMAVEHWDNIQKREGPNPSNHTMVDGPTDATDHDKTESNREIVRCFINEVLIDGHLDQLQSYIDAEGYIEHNPRMEDRLPTLISALSGPDFNHKLSIQYERNHRILAEGNFVLSVSEGFINRIHTSFYDLFRIVQGKIMEHWDTTEAVPPPQEWMNDNGKF